MSIMNFEVNDQLVCVQCGSTVVNALYKKYNTTVLKLTECNSCQKIADKYVEYDGVIILIDLILFNQEAYRHILYNTSFKNHWKIGLIIFFLKTFNHWMTETGFIGKNQRPFVTESAIYAVAAHTFIGCLAYFLVIITMLAGTKWSNPQSFLLQWKALVLSNISQFFLLPSMIWQDLNRETHIIFVMIYSVVSQIQALSVVTKKSRLFLGGILVAAILAETYSLKMTSLFFT